MQNFGGSEISRLAWLESELKLKNFELQRTSLLLLESEEKVVGLSKEKAILEEKLQIVKEEYTVLKLESEHKVSVLDRQIQDLGVKLSVYTKQEEDLDGIILDSATLPESSCTQRLTLEYGSKIPTTPQRRIQQSVSLARQVLRLEKLHNDLKATLFAERDERRILEEELHEVKVALSLSAYPTCELLELNCQKDRTITKLQSQLKNVQAKEASLRRDVAIMKQYKVDIEKRLQECISANEAYRRFKVKSDRDRRHFKTKVKYEVEGASHQNSENVRKIQLPWSMTLPRTQLSSVLNVDDVHNERNVNVNLQHNVPSAFKVNQALTRTKILPPQVPS